MAARIGFADHQRLRLGQYVGQQQGVVTLQGVARFFDGDKLHRHHISALVQHLKVGVLAIGAALAPGHRRGAKGQGLALAVHAFAIAFHFQLLQIGR